MVYVQDELIIEIDSLHSTVHSLLADQKTDCRFHTFRIILRATVSTSPLILSRDFVRNSTLMKGVQPAAGRISKTEGSPLGRLTTR